MAHSYNGLLHNKEKGQSNNTCDGKFRFGVMSKAPDKSGRAVWLHFYEIQAQTKLIYDDKVSSGDTEFQERA